MGESVRAIELSTNLFTTNSKGMPVLPKDHEKAVFDFFPF